MARRVARVSAAGHRLHAGAGAGLSRAGHRGQCGVGLPRRPQRGAAVVPAGHRPGPSVGRCAALRTCPRNDLPCQSGCQDTCFGQPDPGDRHTRRAVVMRDEPPGALVPRVGALDHPALGLHHAAAGNCLGSQRLPRVLPGAGAAVHLDADVIGSLDGLRALRRHRLRRPTTSSTPTPWRRPSQRPGLRRSGAVRWLP